MKITVRRVLILCLLFGLSRHLPCYAAPTSAEAADLAKAKTVLENHDASPSARKTTIEQLTALINKNPNLSEAYCYRGEIYQQMRNATESLKDFNKAIELNPKLSRAYKGLILLRSRKLDVLRNNSDEPNSIEVKQNRRSLWYTGSREAMTRR